MAQLVLPKLSDLLKGMINYIGQSKRFHVAAGRDARCCHRRCGCCLDACWLQVGGGARFSEERHRSRRFWFRRHRRRVVFLRGRCGRVERQLFWLLLCQVATAAAAAAAAAAATSPCPTMHAKQLLLLLMLPQMMATTSSASEDEDVALCVANQLLLLPRI